MFIRKRLTYANVVATLALVFAMSGGALAASKYLITSTKQISPKVIKSLKGKAGPRGKQGLAGPTGPAGKEGQAGKNGENGKEGPPGPSDAYEASSPEATEVSTTPKTLTVTLPPGSYDITGKAQNQNHNSTKSSLLHCELLAGTESLDEMYVNSLPDSSEYGYGDSAAIVHASLVTSATTTVTLECTNGGGATPIFVNHPTLSAIKVGAVHG